MSDESDSTAVDGFIIRSEDRKVALDEEGPFVCEIPYGDSLILAEEGSETAYLVSDTPVTPVDHR